MGLNIVIIANNNPANVPSIPNHDKAGFDQVIDALITSKSSERPVLFTTPLIVITPKSEVDPDIAFLNVSDCNAGFAVLIDKCLFMFFYLLYSYPGLSRVFIFIQNF